MNYVNKINEFAHKNKLAIGNVQYPKESMLGTSSICAHVKDGKGILYCHTSGKYQGEVFYVPLGIGWFYKNVIRGSQGQIGLPISHEIKMVQDGNKTQVKFEAGVIEYDRLTNSCKALSVVKEMVL